MDNPWILVGSKKTSGGQPTTESYHTTHHPSPKETERHTPWETQFNQIELGIQVLIEKEFQHIRDAQYSGNNSLYKHDWMHI